jgi:RNA polymerase sigma factor (sigma-70 family)
MEADIDPAVVDAYVDNMTASQALAEKESERALLQAIARLPAEAKLILDLRHKFGWTFTQIGEHVGISEQAVRKRWTRILAQLRKDLVHDEPSA